MGEISNEEGRLDPLVHWLFPDSCMDWEIQSRARRRSPTEEKQCRGFAAAGTLGRSGHSRSNAWPQARPEAHLAIVCCNCRPQSRVVAGMHTGITRNPLQLSSAVAGQRSSTVRRISDVHGRVAAHATSAVAEHMRPQSRSAFVRSRGASLSVCVNCT